MTERQKTEWFKVVRYDNVQAIEEIINECFDINCQSSFGWTALHWACYRNQLNIIKTLINHGADINIQNDNYRTPLHIAFRWGGHIETAKLLIENGADITIKNIDGDTPLDELKVKNYKQYEELMVWLAEHHPEKMLEYMANDKAQDKGVVGL